MQVWEVSIEWLSYRPGQQDGEDLLTSRSRDLHRRGTTRVSGCQRQVITRVCRSSMAAETRGLGLQVDSMQFYADLLCEILAESAPSSKN